jgi:hypothetical protein
MHWPSLRDCRTHFPCFDEQYSSGFDAHLDFSDHTVIRVSTAKQGRSGLGLEAQQEALQRFAEANGFAFLETLTEVERRRAPKRV